MVNQSLSLCSRAGQAVLTNREQQAVGISMKCSWLGSFTIPFIWTREGSGNIKIEASPAFWIYLIRETAEVCRKSRKRRRNMPHSSPFQIIHSGRLSPSVNQEKEES